MHRPALGMSADDDVLHVQVHHRELDGSGLGFIRGGMTIGTAAGNQISDVSDDEEIARIGGSEGVRNHSAVGAGDEKGIRSMPQGEAGELLPVFRQGFPAKLDNSSNQFLHIKVFLFDLRRARHF
jgi:hypothetical protein